MEAQQQQQPASGDAKDRASDLRIAETKSDLEQIRTMKKQLGAAVAASDFTRVQTLATRLRTTELKQQLKAAVAAQDFEEVTRLGRELDEYKKVESNFLVAPAPEPEPEPEAGAELGAGAVWGSEPNAGAAAAYRAWEDKLANPDQPDDSDSGAMQAL